MEVQDGTDDPQKKKGKKNKKGQSDNTNGQIKNQETEPKKEVENSWQQYEDEAILSINEPAPQTE